MSDLQRISLRSTFRPTLDPLHSRVQAGTIYPQEQIMNSVRRAYQLKRFEYTKDNEDNNPNILSDKNYLRNLGK